MQINNPSAAAAVWGGITGTLTAQTDLNAALTGKRAVAAGTNQVYVRNNTGVETTVGYNATSPAANTIAQRGASGEVSVGTPTNTTHATPQSYVNAQFSPNTRAAVGALTGASTAADIVTALQTL